LTLWRSVWNGCHLAAIQTLLSPKRFEADAGTSGGAPSLFGGDQSAVSFSTTSLQFCQMQPPLSLGRMQPLDEGIAVTTIAGYRPLQS
jgi:hypothetical protein